MAAVNPLTVALLRGSLGMALSSDKVALVALASCIVLWQCGLREWTLAWGPGRSRRISEIISVRCSASPGPYPLLPSLKSELYSLKIFSNTKL